MYYRHWSYHDQPDYRTILFREHEIRPGKDGRATVSARWFLHTTHRGNSRRNFIKKSALGAAGITIGGVGMSARDYGKIIGANDRLNVAIVGLGRRLGGFIEPIARKASNVRLLYLCDVMESQRERAAERFSKNIDYVPLLENDVRRIYEDKRVDAIIDLTPDHWHAPGTCYAVKAGKHVYVEKPCSHNPREGELLCRIAKETEQERDLM